MSLLCFLIILLTATLLTKKHSVHAIAAPTNLVVNKTSTSQTSFTWTSSSSSGITNYSVYRNGSIVGATDQWTTNYYDHNLLSNTAYVYTVIANSGSQSSVASSPLNITTGSTTTVISSCGTTISSSGNYILNGDLTGTAGTICVDINTTNNVSLDCQNHTMLINGTGFVVPISVNNVNNFLITNCNLLFTQSQNTAPILMNNSSLGTIENNVFGENYNMHNSKGNIQLQNTSHIVFNGNSFQTVYFVQNTSNNNYIGNNTFTWNRNAGSPPGNINTSQSSFNVINKNVMDGDSPAFNVGADDGIIIGGSIGHETNDLINANTVNNVYDAGIETVGYVANTVISNNTINYAYFAGISSYHYTSLLNNTFTNNTVTKSPSLFTFFDDKAVPAGEHIYFQDNIFSSNNFVPSGTAVYVSSFDFRQQLNNGTLIAGNNILTSNNFGDGPQYLEVVFSPSSIFRDGGGNICPDITSKVNKDFGQTAGTYPIKCRRETTGNTTSHQGRLLLINSLFAAYGKDNLSSGGWHPITGIADGIQINASGKHIAIINGGGSAYSADVSDGNLANNNPGLQPVNVPEDQNYSGGVKKIVVDDKGNMMAINNCDAAYGWRNIVGQLTWVKMTSCGDANDVKVGNGRMALINSCGGAFISDSSYSWTQILSCGDARQIAIGETGRIMIVNGSGTAYIYNPGKGVWINKTAPGDAAKIAIGKDRIMIVTSGGAAWGSDVGQDNYAGMTQLTANGDTAAIAVGSGDRMAIINSAGAAYASEVIVTGGMWTNESANGDAFSIAVG